MSFFNAICQQTKNRNGCVHVMNDWSNNSNYDMQNSFIDYLGANSGKSGASSDWWK